jgi:hypothetical protein
LIPPSPQKPHIILHAGGPKTGTSSIQRTFHPQKSSISQKILSELPFQMLARQSSPADFDPECNQGRNLDLIWGKRLDEVLINKWKLDLKRQTARNANYSRVSYVFSAERAGAPQLNMRRCKQLAELLTAFGTVTKVLYYARPLLALSLSLGLQQVKAFAIKPLSGRLFHRIGKISCTHVVDKYNYFRASYPDSQIDFRVFSKGELDGSDVRLDFAGQLATAKNLLELLRLELLALPSANESIDLPALLIMNKMYNILEIPENTRIPSLFNQFLSLGSWKGPRCSLLDLYTEDQIKFLHAKSLEEIEMIRDMAQPTRLDCFKRMADQFVHMLPPLQDCLNRNSAENNLDSYTFKLTCSQRFLLQDALARLEGSFLDSCVEHRCLKVILESVLDQEHLAVEVFPVVYSAGLKLS